MLARLHQYLIYWLITSSSHILTYMYQHCMCFSGRVLDSRPKGRGFEPHRRHCVVSLSKNINPSLVLVQPRKTRPFITERLLMGRKESNQTNKNKTLHVLAHYQHRICWLNYIIISCAGSITSISHVLAQLHQYIMCWLIYINISCAGSITSISHVLAQLHQYLMCWLNYIIISCACSITSTSHVLTHVSISHVLAHVSIFHQHLIY